MRGADQRSEGIFSYVRLEQRVPADHPLRAIRDLVDAALKELSRDFGGFTRAKVLLQAFYTVRSATRL